MKVKDIKKILLERWKLEKENVIIEWNKATFYKYKNDIYILCKDRNSLEYYSYEYQWNYNVICISSEEEIYFKIYEANKNITDIKPWPKYNIWDVVYSKDKIFKISSIYNKYWQFEYYDWVNYTYEDRIIWLYK